MASNFHLIVLLVLISISVTSGYTLSTRDAVSKKYDDKLYFRASSEKVLSMIVVKDLKARSRQAIVVVNKVSKGGGLLKRKHKSNKVGSLDVLTLVGIIILAVIVTCVIIAFLYNLYHVLKTENTQSIGQREMGAKEMGHETDEKTQTVTMSPQAGKRSNGDANV